MIKNKDRWIWSQTAQLNKNTVLSKCYTLPSSRVEKVNSLRPPIQELPFAQKNLNWGSFISLIILGNLSPGSSNLQKILFANYKYSSQILASSKSRLSRTITNGVSVRSSTVDKMVLKDGWLKALKTSSFSLIQFTLSIHDLFAYFPFHHPEIVSEVWMGERAKRTLFRPLLNNLFLKPKM